MGCQTSKRTSAAGNPAANKNIDTKAKVFPATSWLLDFNGTLKSYCYQKAFSDSFLQIFKISCHSSISNSASLTTPRR